MMPQIVGGRCRCEQYSNGLLPLKWRFTEQCCYFSQMADDLLGSSGAARIQGNAVALHVSLKNQKLLCIRSLRPLQSGG